MESIVAACNRQVSRAKKKLDKYREKDKVRWAVAGNFGRKASLMPALRKGRSMAPEKDDEDEAEEAGHKDEAVWRKTILMGEKCDPLDFAGVIYYDSEGRMLDHVPSRTPRHRSAIASTSSPLPSLLFASAAHAPEKNGKKGSAGGVDR